MDYGIAHIMKNKKENTMYTFEDIKNVDVEIADAILAEFETEQSH